MFSRRTFTVEQKLKVISYAELHGIQEAANRYGINVSSVRLWIKKSNEYKMADNVMRSQRCKKSLWPEVEIELKEWLLKERETNDEITIFEIKNKAVKLAKELGIGSFKGTFKWCKSFLKKHNLRLKKSKCSKRDLPHNWQTKAIAFKSSVEEAVPGVDLKFIGNMDEVLISFNIPSGYLIYRQSSQKIKAFITGDKKCSFTVTLCITADGSKLPPFIIFKNDFVPNDDYPKDVIVTGNVSALMTRKTMMEWFEKVWMKRIGKSENKESLLIYDSASAHIVNDFVNEVKAASTLCIIPNGLTKLLQPLNYSIKERFRKNLNKHWKVWMIEGFHYYNETGNVRSLSFNEVCEWVKKSWDDITPESIVKAFKRTKVNYYGSDEIINDNTCTPVESDVEDLDIPDELTNCLIFDDIESDEEFSSFD